MRAPLAIACDWNLDFDYVQHLYAPMVDGKAVPGWGPDSLIFRDARLEKVYRLGKRGSDHHVVIYDLTTDAGDRVRILWWNVYQGHDPDQVGAVLADLVDRYHPDFIGLAEAYRCRKVLKAIAGYRRFQGLNIGERADVAILVRRSLKVDRRRVLAMLQRWIGPKHNLPKAPRYYRAVRVLLPSGRPFRFCAGHLPTGGTYGRNAAAVKESLRKLKVWAG